jgi:serine/threonine-protein kinase
MPQPRHDALPCEAAWKRSKLWLLLLLVVLLLGCQKDAGVTLRAFTLRLPTGQKQEVILPARLGLPKTNVDYTLTTAVDLPAELRGQALTLSLGNVGAMVTARANGVPLAPVRPGMLDTYRTTEPVVFHLPENLTREGTLSIELTVAHRWYKSAIIEDAPIITSRPLGPDRVVMVSTWNDVTALLALAASAVVVLLYSFVWISMRGARSRPYGFFAIGALTGLFYPAFLLGLTQPLFGAYDVAVMGVMLVTGSVAALYFSRSYFQLARPHRAWLAVPPFALVVCMAGHNPFYAVRVIGVLIGVVGTVHAVAQIVVMSRLQKSGHVSRNLWPIALAWPITAVVGLPDFAPWFGFGELAHGVRTACIGITTIAIYQAVALSREHLLALRRSDELVTELNKKVDTLSASNREVAMLNDELRRQIALRSKELVVRLADMDAGVVIAPKLEGGDLFEGRYRVLRMLGQGGMGAVYEVERQLDNRKFALKVFSGGDSYARARFAREAQICAEVKHPNVVTIVDVDVAKQGFPFMVMELMTDGKTLYDVRRRKQDTRWTLGVLLQVCDGMSAIHAAGIIHRDLKPSNILLSRGHDGTRPTIKITDFGISAVAGEARLSDMIIRASAVSGAALEEEAALAAGLTPQAHLEYDDEAATEILDPADQATRIPDSKPVSGPRSDDFTATGVIFGTPQYMAGELTQGTKSATRSSDMFAIGIIAFELLVGKRPFRESPLEARLKGRAMPTPPPFASVCPDLPREVAVMLDLTLSHDSAARPEARALGDSIRSALSRMAS